LLKKGGENYGKKESSSQEKSKKGWKETQIRLKNLSSFYGKDP